MGNDGGGRAGGEEEPDFTHEIRGEEVRAGLGGGGFGGAERVGGCFGFAEEESFAFRGRLVPEWNWDWD